MTTQKNVTSLRLGAQVLTARVEQVVSQLADVAFDVVFADPPYDLDAALVDGMVATAVRNGWVAEDGLVVLERSRRTAAVRWPTGFDGWSRHYGETTVYFGQRGSVGQLRQDPEPE